FRFLGPLFGGFGPLLDLAQASLGLDHRALAGVALVFQLLFGGGEVDRRRHGGLLGGDGRRLEGLGRRRLSRGRLRRQRRRRRSGTGAGDRGRALQPFGLAHPAVGLGADSLLLEADFGDLVADPLLGRDGVVLLRRRGDGLPDRGRRHRADQRRLL